MCVARPALRYWAALRAAWAEIARTKGGIAIEEEADTGTAVSARLLQLADELAAERLAEPAAVAEARRLIQEQTRPVQVASVATASR